jgi:hypothetical protein
MIIITVTNNKTGMKMKLEKETFQYLQTCKEDYFADAKGLADAGIQQTDNFRNYVDFKKLESFEGGLDMAEKRFSRFVYFYDLL